MAYVFIRFFLGIYLLVIGAVVLTAFSELLFGSRKFVHRFKEVGRRLVLAPIWPLLLFSSGGVSKIFRYVHNL